MTLTLEIFVDLSVVLTGFSKDKLQPTHDTLKLSEEYYDTLVKEVAAPTLNQLAEAFTSLQDPSGNVDLAKFKEEIINNTDLGPIAKNIIQMWYVGIWYYIPFNAGEGYIISDNAYTHGLVWTAMQAHPMGYSEENFGYWETAPAGETAPNNPGYGSN